MQAQTATLIIRGAMMIGFCIVVGVAAGVFLTPGDVAWGLVAVVAVFGFGFVARFGRLGFAQEFPFVRFRFVFPSIREVQDKVDSNEH